MYEAKYVLKNVVEEQTVDQLWGIEVHKAFEDYVAIGKALPAALAEHESYLAQLKNQPGEVFAEQKVALNIRCQPTGYFDKDVWWRGIIDYRSSHMGIAKIVDYKTGKVKPKPQQLHIAMLYAFALGADVAEAEFYWTQTKGTTKIVFPRSSSARILTTLKPLLFEYAEAWHKNIWRPKPSGLCNGWCPVKECEYWKAKRR